MEKLDTNWKIFETSDSEMFSAVNNNAFDIFGAVNYFFNKGLFIIWSYFVRLDLITKERILDILIFIVWKDKI